MYPQWICFYTTSSQSQRVWPVSTLPAAGTAQRRGDPGERALGAVTAVGAGQALVSCRGRCTRTLHSHVPASLSRTRAQPIGSLGSAHPTETANRTHRAFPEGSCRPSEPSRAACTRRVWEGRGESRGPLRGEGRTLPSPALSRGPPAP